jgi:hypothetical protein
MKAPRNESPVICKMQKTPALGRYRHISKCQPTTHTKEKDLDRIERPLYNRRTRFTGSKIR